MGCGRLNRLRSASSTNHQRPPHSRRSSRRWQGEFGGLRVRIAAAGPLCLKHGRLLFYEFDTSICDKPRNRSSNVRRLREKNGTGAVLSDYEYNSLVVELRQPDVKLDYLQDTSSTHAGYDPFGRIN